MTGTVEIYITYLFFNILEYVKCKIILCVDLLNIQFSITQTYIFMWILPHYFYDMCFYVQLRRCLYKCLFIYVWQLMEVIFLSNLYLFDHRLNFSTVWFYFVSLLSVLYLPIFILVFIHFVLIVIFVVTIILQ